MTAKQFWFVLLAITALALALRVWYPLADPPWQTTVGIVWHDEGAWAHNARNRALFGAWTLDAWNPMYLAPVFTGLEYVSFRLFHVGLWQARLVSELAGAVSVVLLGLGVARSASREAGAVAAGLLATNYVYVMWNRAALMEATMVSFMVAAWCAVATASDLDAKTAYGRGAVWGWFAGPAALLAFFTKAAAAFFVVALGVAALLELRARRHPAMPRATKPPLLVLGGLLTGGAVALVIFVWPYWPEFRFYNWQMSVTRKPSYALNAFLDRASWLPIVHDFFTRMWFVTVLASAGLVGILVRWHRATMAERVLALWVVFGVAELVLHDVGNERRLIFLIPPLVALAAIVLTRDRRLLPAEFADLSVRRALLAAPLVFFLLYILCGALLRLPFLYDVKPGVRWSAAAATLLGLSLYARWPRHPRWLAAQCWPLRGGIALALVLAAGDVAQFVQWATGRTYKNYEAMLAVGRRLPAGTLVHGKLANGLALENGIRPIFVGRGFGNYEDRRSRHDVRYVLTYLAPRLGYEGPVITEVLDASPGWRVIDTFDVAETSTGHDRAALIDKQPEQPRQGSGAALKPPGAAPPSSRVRAPDRARD